MSWRRLLVAGLLLAAAAAAGGFAFEWLRFGRDGAQASARVDAAIRRDFDGMTSLLARVGSAIARDADTARALHAVRSQQAGREAARTLFDVLDRHLGDVKARADVAVTIYDFPDGVARAWADRPSDIPIERIRSPRSWFVTPSSQGLRLVHVLPVSGTDETPLGVVAMEHALSPTPAEGTLAPSEYLLPTDFGFASLRLSYEGAGEGPRADHGILLRAPTDEVLIEASISPEQIAQARNGWRRRTAAAVLGILSLTVLLLVGPVLDRRSAVHTTGAHVRLTTLAAVLVAGGAGLGFGAIAAASPGGPGPRVLLLVCSAAVAAVIALLATPISQVRAAMRARRRRPAASRIGFVAAQVVAGALMAGLLVVFEMVLKRALEGAPVDLGHFSLHPWSAERLMLLMAILAANLAALWAAVLLLAASLIPWRLDPHRRSRVLLVLASWILPAVAVAVIAANRELPIPALGIVLSASVCATAALLARRASRWFRRATVAARILSLFVAFVIPSLLLYPSVNFFIGGALRSMVAGRFAVEAQNHPQMLQQRMKEVQDEIDAMPGLGELVSEQAAVDGRGTESAFLVWRQTALARERLTSAVELYGPHGELISRFALNFPEYTGTVQAAPATSECTWEVFGEAARFGSEERRMLHAERSICERLPEGGLRVLGSIVLHIVLDYRTLPFITSQSPYFEVFRTQGGVPAEGTTGSEVEIAIYGWGLTPLYASGRAAWPISDELFARIYGSREPFWTELRRGNTLWNVYFSNDRNGIYGLGYPALTLFDRFVHIAELTTLAGGAFVLVLLATAVFTRIARERPRVGRALLREIRVSFYRKLFLAFVLASIIPVLTLALVIRTYFAGLLRADVEAEAARSASVAKRVIEESQALQPFGTDQMPTANDDVMIWISQVIDQDVNVFRGPELLATSERDLFASGLLPTRTPADVYRAIALHRLPSFVGEDRIATLPYMIAAAPVRAGDRDAILTVPLANQQREIEREIDEIDRGVHLAALFFVLLGAGIGLSMAERIADPVRRLTRATRRIASGDFDARIAVRSADELRRLVDAFNSMAAELKAQRTQLERTHRLEAWAEMARQVAHEIKNPLTPIQLSAEHLRRVHVDRGEPMGAVLDGCVNAILGQVRLLRQISSEFSNFASSPIARPAAVNVPELVAEVVDPYRTGLEGRVQIHNHVTSPLPAVFVDRTLVSRALSNIVENALHAMPSGGSITLTSDSEPGSVILRITDTGLGMDEEALARVFEPYFSTKATGTGLGLPIARRNIELSGGRIEVESVKGNGTTVVLRLPTAG